MWSEYGIFECGVNMEYFNMERSFIGMRNCSVRTLVLKLLGKFCIERRMNAARTFEELSCDTDQHWDRRFGEP